MDLTERVMDLTERVADLANRVMTLTERVTALEQVVAVIKSNYATKADVLEAKNSIIMWLVSAVVLAQLLPGLLKKLGAL